MSWPWELRSRWIASWHTSILLFAHTCFAALVEGLQLICCGPSPLFLNSKLFTKHLPCKSLIDRNGGGASQQKPQQSMGLSRPRPETGSNGDSFPEPSSAAVQALCLLEGKSQSCPCLGSVLLQGRPRSAHVASHGALGMRHSVWP